MTVIVAMAGVGLLVVALLRAALSPARWLLARWRLGRVGFTAAVVVLVLVALAELAGHQGGR